MDLGSGVPTRAHASSLRVLVVDDNEDAAASLASLLQVLGHAVAVAHDGEQALREGERLRPEVVLLDLGTPRLNGYEICRRLRAQPWGVPATVIAVTGWGEDEDRRRTAAAGFDHHCVKPMDPAELTHLLGELQAARAGA